MNDGVRILVTGSRDAICYGDVAAVLDWQHGTEPVALIIHGGQRGIDSLAGQWAAAREIPCLVVPARWAELGKPAGPIRNKAMLNFMGIVPDKVLAFPGGVGTANMIAAAKAAGVPVFGVGGRP